jgi:hypothetical protein
MTSQNLKNKGNSALILIDVHVHIYNCFDLKRFFVAAQKNFQAAAQQISGENNFSGVLLLTDWAGQNWFKKVSEFINLPDSERRPKLGDWEWHHSKEKNSFYFEDLNKNKIFIVSGRKIISSENLEILALSTDDITFEDGLSLQDTVNTILANQSIPIIPWAVGKWLGKRGEVLDSLISEFDPQQYFLCDNGNRPFFWSKPSHFTKFEKKGGRLLSGSDPLHFPSETGRAGGFGCWVKSDLEIDNPSEWLRSVLREPSKEIQLYGKLETPLRFFRNQLNMQLLKKKWKSTYYRK